MFTNICILRLSALGDVANCLPTLRAIQTQYPEAQITWIIAETEYQLVRDIDKVNWVVIDKHKIFSSWLILRKLGEFDVVLHMQAALRASILKTALKTKLTIGLDKDRARDFQNWFTDKTIATKDDAHTVETHLGFAEAIGAGTEPKVWNLPVAEMAKEIIDVDLPEDYFVLSPCASNSVRNWQVKNYIRVINYIFDKYQLPCVLTGGFSKIERQYGTEIDKECLQVTNLIGKLTIRQSAAIIARGRFLISPDSGPVHIASATETKVLGLYASANPKRTGPYNCPKFVVNQYPQAVKKFLRKDVHDVKFGTRVCNDKVMELIKIDMVTKMVARIIKNSSQ